jgi:hypothetical protein
MTSVAQNLTSKMKGIVKRTLEENPWLRRNRFYYELQRYRQFRPCRVDRSLAERPEVVDELVRDGYCIIPHFANRETCEAILRELETPLAELLAGTYKGRHQVHSFPEAYRMLGVDEVSPTAAREFFANPFLESIARAYVGPTAVSYRREGDFKVNEVHGGKFLQSELPHFDDWRHRFKAFLYLTDVGTENAPFVYYPRTHTYAEWKRPYCVDYEVEGLDGRYGHFFPQEMRRLTEEHGFRPVECTGPAGTLILADFRGIHRGTTIRGGRRILLNNTWGIVLDGF